MKIKVLQYNQLHTNTLHYSNVNIFPNITHLHLYVRTHTYTLPTHISTLYSGVRCNSDIYIGSECNREAHKDIPGITLYTHVRRSHTYVRT